MSIHDDRDQQHVLVKAKDRYDMLVSHFLLGYVVGGEEGVSFESQHKVVCGTLASGEHSIVEFNFSCNQLQPYLESQLQEHLQPEPQQLGCPQPLNYLEQSKECYSVRDGDDAANRTVDQALKPIAQ